MYEAVIAAKLTQRDIFTQRGIFIWRERFLYVYTERYFVYTQQQCTYQTNKIHIDVNNKECFGIMLSCRLG